MSNNIVLGIDPGIERLGWALVEKQGDKIVRIDSGVKKTPKEKQTSQRLLEIFNFLDTLIKKAKPEAMSIEKLFFSKNVKTALTVGEVRGVILTVAEKNALPITEFTPQQIKVAVCGYGGAKKEEVAAMLKFSLELPKRSLLDDETDALAIGLTLAVTRRFP